MYDKSRAEQKRIRPVYEHTDFSSNRYYSMGEQDDALENRIASFECEIAPLISQIDAALENVCLTKKQLELLKLYCSLCAYRHANTCEVIKSDESGIYRSNRYLIGTHRIESQEDAIKVTSLIIDEFERIRAVDERKKDKTDSNTNQNDSLSSYLTRGLHLSIVRADSSVIMISDRFCILENTLDSDHLYAYIPISPQTALLLVNSAYYFDLFYYQRTCIRFGNIYGVGTPDPFLSYLFGSYVGAYEDRLFYAAFSDPSMTKLADDNCASLYVKIQRLPKEVFRLFNSIYCEDGSIVLFCEKEELDYALSHRLSCRDIKVSF